MKTLNDATPGSSPAPGDQRETSPNSPDVQKTRDSSTATEGDQAKPKSDEEKLNELLTKEDAEATGDSPSTKTEAEGDDAPEKDESGADKPEADAENVLSQEEQQQQQSEQAIEKAFTERPEWQAALKLVAPEKQKELRQVLRPILEREQRLTAHFQRTKPDVEAVQKLRTTLGDDGVTNGFALMEMWHRGDPKAKEILTELLTDLDTRTGAVLSSPDLVKKADSLKQRLESGLIDQAEHDELLGLLKETEQSRAGVKQTKAQAAEAEKATAAQRQEKLITDRTQAINAWEKTTAGKDPDYARIQIDVINRAKLKTEEQTEKANRLLSPSEMVAIMDEAYKEAKEYARSFQPKPNRIKPIRHNDSDSSETSKRKPQTDMEKLDALIEQEGG